MQSAKDSHREKYVVKVPEDLVNIARKKFVNPSISQLIFELNPGKVDVKWVNGKPVYTAKPGVTLVLPSQNQVKEWLIKKANIGRREQTTTISNVSLSSRQEVQADERRSNIEKILGKIKEAAETRSYAVRLGDTLRSVAMKHPELRDVSLWKLLAAKNGLAVETDAKGSPLAILIRGASIVIPTAEEIEDYREQNSFKVRKPEPQAATARMNEWQNVATKPCPGCKRLLSANSSLCPACGFVFEAKSEPSITSQATTFPPLPDAPTTLSLVDQGKTVVQNAQDVTTIVDLSSATGVANSSLQISSCAKTGCGCLSSRNQPLRAAA